MSAVELSAAGRRLMFVEGNSHWPAARVCDQSRQTVGRMCRFLRPPRYTRTKLVTKPKPGLLLPIIDTIVNADFTAPVKKRHTANRIFERRRDREIVSAIGPKHRSRTQEASTS